MYLLLSGEGPSDVGICHPSADYCEHAGFSEGPMAIIVDQLVESIQGFEMSHLDTERVVYVSEAYLAENKLPSKKKSMALKGKKKPAETKYFYDNARVLASIAKMKSEEIDDVVVAVLFRDSDGTASAGRGNWLDKRNSMLEGFKAEDFEFGVPMVPKPKSEAWLLCALKDNPYQHCAAIENESGNDNSTNSLKDQLAARLNGNADTNQIKLLLRDGSIDVNRIDMPSFDFFKIDLQSAVTRALE